MDRLSEIKQLFDWNIWANEKYRGVLEKIPLENLKVETPYGKLLDRIVHIFASFKMWTERMKGGSPQSVISANEFSNWKDLESTWIEYEQILMNYIDQLEDSDLDKTVTYTSFDGTIYTRQIRHILLHLTAHPNYHRGQISAIFKLLELPTLPSTDMVIYFLNN